MTKSTGIRLKLRPRIVNGKMTCIMCNIPKVLNEFSETSRNVLGIMHTCKTCNADRLKLRLCNPESYFRHLSSNLKHSAKTKILPFDLDWQFLKQMYDEQSGRCFYTDEEMRTARGQGHSRMALSTDKIVPEQGYQKTNVVLVTKRANLIKNDMTLAEMREWMPTWFARLQGAGLCS